MKLRDKLVISVLAGLLAMSLYTSPRWWGVLFSPLTETICKADTASTDGICWQVGDHVLRFRSLDLLIEFLQGLRSWK